jgi:hypothetical protein
MCLHTNPENMRHIPTRFRSGCAAICAITREMNRYMTPNPRNESVYAPLAIVMRHIPTHLGRKTHERTHGIDVRTRGIDERTRLARERTRVLRTNPRGQIDAGCDVFARHFNALGVILGAVQELRPGRPEPEHRRWPSEPESRLTPMPEYDKIPIPECHAA